MVESFDGQSAACTSNDCKVLAQWLRVKVDHNVDPCDDFYHFVCDDYKDANALQKITWEVTRIGLSAARASTVPATGQTAWQKATALFKACLSMVDTKRVETTDLTAWMISLGLDLNNLTSSDRFEVVDMIVRLSLDFGIPVILAFAFDSEALLNNKRLMFLSFPQPDIDRLNFEEAASDRSQAELRAFYESMLRMYGVHSSRIEGVATELKEYENYFGEIAATLTSTMQGITDPVRIRDMGAATAPTITAEMWAGPIAKYTKNKYGGNDFIYQKSIPLGLAKALESKDIGPHGMWCCMAWSLFCQLVQFTHPDLLVKHRNPEHVCYDQTRSLMGYAITSRFFLSVVSKETLMEADEMASNIRKAYEAAFRSSSWMTGSVRETALRKITNMRQDVAAVGALLDGAYVEKYYASFPDLPTDRFFKAWREAAAAAVHQAAADTTMLLNKDTEVNAYYVARYNKMVIQPSILLPHFIFTDGPAAYNYGSLGRMLGHEMMHGYDVKGSQYDENTKQRRWFSPESSKHYLNITLCLRHLHMNVLRQRQEVLNETLDSENLADLGGTTMAYSAFRSLPPSKRDTTLPGVTMTANQLFFVGHCTTWCEKQTREPAPWLSGRDRYPPGRSRCIVPLMNMPEFSDAYHCTRGSYMNPSNKCKFWT
ncbi:neprilysin-1-like [Dermacentor andersoni]|uniref:neprilysin-1-like n=1 Tax=Dermacentor andersoni TaxID=34620 RepID=UPI0024173A54|nr:neprilysin-1-like [Dermacentor andersoni]